jgi:hypothetical protein
VTSTSKPKLTITAAALAMTTVPGAAVVETLAAEIQAGAPTLAVVILVVVILAGATAAVVVTAAAEAIFELLL